MNAFEKISPDDPRLTAYALDEMEPAERAEFEQLLQRDASARAVIAEITGTARHIGVALANEPEAVGQISAPTLGQAAIIAGKNFHQLDGGPLSNGKNMAGEYASPAKWLRFPQMYFAISGLAAACFAIGFVLWQSEYMKKPQVRYTQVDLNKIAPAKTAEAGAMEGDEVAAGAGTAENLGADSFVTVKREPVSAFPIKRGTLAYANVRGFIRGGRLPPRNAVRIEEMVNYFPYSYAAPTGDDELFAAHLEVASAPWAPEHRLVRIGLKGRESQAAGALATIAKGVKLQVEFNPRKVQSYRLIGYENRMPRNEDTNNGSHDTGEIAAGHTLTALYEIIPAAADTLEAIPVGDELKYQKTTAPVLRNSSELLTLKVRYQEPVGDESSEVEFALRDTGRAFDEASTDFQFAASVAAFGMILRDSPHQGSATFAQVRQWAQAGLGDDAGGYRSEFVGLVDQAKRLSRN